MKAGQDVRGARSPKEHIGPEQRTSPSAQNVVEFLSQPAGTILVADAPPEPHLIGFKQEYQAPASFDQGMALSLALRAC